MATAHTLYSRRSSFGGVGEQLLQVRVGGFGHARYGRGDGLGFRLHDQTEKSKIRSFSVGSDLIVVWYHFPCIWTGDTVDEGWHIATEFVALLGYAILVVGSNAILLLFGLPYQADCGW